MRRLLAIVAVLGVMVGAIGIAQASPGLNSSIVLPCGPGSPGEWTLPF